MGPGSLRRAIERKSPTLLHRSIRTGSSIFANYRATGRSLAHGLCPLKLPVGAENDGCVPNVALFLHDRPLMTLRRRAREQPLPADPRRAPLIAAKNVAVLSAVSIIWPYGEGEEE